MRRLGLLVSALLFQGGLVSSLSLGAVLEAAQQAEPETRQEAQAPVSDKHYLAPYVFIATGSGVIVSDAGEILTNAHVITEVCSPLEPHLEIRLPGVGEVAAELVAVDPVGDLALIRLTGKHPPLTAATFSERIPPPGTMVVAVGNPFALGDIDDRPSVSRGVLGTGRVVRGSYSDCLQHDAPINPGNSGGPLFEVDGHLLGINGAIRSRSGFRINSGIGLAVSAPHLALFLPALRQAGSDRGGWLVRSAIPTGLTLEQRLDGVTVTAGPAPLLPGDILLSVDGRLSPAVDTAIGLFSSHPWGVGHTVQVHIRRSALGKNRSEEKNGELTLAVATSRAPIPGKPWHGLVVTEHDGRMVLDQVDALSPAGRAGVLSGDVLLSVNGATIANRLDLLRITAIAGVGDPLELLLRNPDGAERRIRCFVAQGGP